MDVVRRRPGRTRSAGARPARGRQPAAPVRVEHDRRTLLVHLSDEDGSGWTTLAIDRATRVWAVAQEATQRDAAGHAVRALDEQR